MSPEGIAREIVESVVEATTYIYPWYISEQEYMPIGQIWVVAAYDKTLFGFEYIGKNESLVFREHGEKKLVLFLNNSNKTYINWAKDFLFEMMKQTGLKETNKFRKNQIIRDLLLDILPSYWEVYRLDENVNTWSYFVENPLINPWYDTNEKFKTINAMADKLAKEQSISLIPVFHSMGRTYVGVAEEINTIFVSPITNAKEI